MQVSDLMTESVITLDPEDDLALAEKLMAESRIRHLPVVDHDFKLVGLLTQRDLLRASLSALHAPQIADRHMKQTVAIERLMTRAFHAIAADMDLKEAADLMRANKYGCLPVVADDGRLIGIITDTDFLRFSSAVLEVFSDATAQRSLIRCLEEGGPKAGEA